MKMRFCTLYLIYVNKVTPNLEKIMEFEEEQPFNDAALSGLDIEKGHVKKTVQNRVEQFTSAKHRQDKIIDHLKKITTGEEKTPKYGFMDVQKTLNQVGDCFNYLIFHDYFTVGENRLVKASSCKKHLLCAPCAIRRASKSVGGYLDKFKEIISENADLVPYMLTLTIKNGQDLKERYEHLQKCVKKLLKSRRDYEKRGSGFNEFCKIQGAVYSYELTYSKHGWHPHIHMIILLHKTQKMAFNPRSKKNSLLSKQWKKITGDSFIVDVRRIYGDPVQGFIEVFKYALKFSDLTPQQTIDAFSLLRGSRLQGSFGLFRGVKIDKDLNEDPLDGLPYMEMYYSYLKSQFTLKSHKLVEI